jgi:hypothetical protein
VTLVVAVADERAVVTAEEDAASALAVERITETSPIISTAFRTNRETSNTEQAP